MASFGEGFAQGINAGTAAAERFIQISDHAKKQREQEALNADVDAWSDSFDQQPKNISAQGTGQVDLIKEVQKQAGEPTPVVAANQPDSASDTSADSFKPVTTAGEPHAIPQASGTAASPLLAGGMPTQSAPVTKPAGVVDSSYQDWMPHARKITASFIKKGDIGSAKAFMEFNRSEEGQRYGADFLKGQKAFEAGDYDGAIPHFARLYNTQRPDGRRMGWSSNGDGTYLRICTLLTRR